MMREIKFRAWDKRKKQFISWEEIKRNTSMNLFGGYFELFNRNEFIPMQYTGLKDCKGNEIYEGDIIKCTVTDNSADYLQIEAGDKHSVLRIISIPELYQEGLSDDGEIIGNIHENKELLKQQ